MTQILHSDVIHSHFKELVQLSNSSTCITHCLEDSDLSFPQHRTARGLHEDSIIELECLIIPERQREQRERDSWRKGLSKGKGSRVAEGGRECVIVQPQTPTESCLPPLSLQQHPADPLHSQAARELHPQPGER